MHRLELLGTTELRNPDGTSVSRVLNQPKRLALLAWFALVPGERYVRRDTILALFWPDLPQGNARAALRRAVYFLRQIMGDGIIEGRGDEELRLGPGRLSCDAVECRAAITQGDAARARALYRGPLLDGFYIEGAAEAEEWLDGERRAMALSLEQLGPPAPTPPPTISISLPAMRDWVSGEQEFQRGRYLPASQHYSAAIRKDHHFALAHYRNASCMAALTMISPAQEMSGVAMSLRAPLAERDRLLIEAQHAWLHGRVAEAEQRYRRIIVAHPDDLEAHSLLGDLLLHHNPYRGRSIREARGPLERTLQLDPSHLSTLVKLTRLDALEGKRDALRARVDEIVQLSPEGDRVPGLRLLRAVALGDRTDEDAQVKALAGAQALTLGITFADVALYGGNAAASERIGRAIAGALRAEELKGLAWLALAHLAAQRRELDECRRLLTLGSAAIPAWGPPARALLVVLPFLAWTEADIAEAEAAVRDWTIAPQFSAAFPPLQMHDRIQEQARACLLGLLAARTGDIPGVEAALQHSSSVVAAEEDALMVERLERLLAAELFRLQRRPEAALAQLQASPTDFWFQDAVLSPLYCGGYERWRRGMLLRELGRESEATGWLESVAERSPWELPFLGER
jgi:tetratricopeptide (TPR) repeat protein